MRSLNFLRLSIACELTAHTCRVTSLVHLGKYIFDDHCSVDGFTKLINEERLAGSEDLEDAPLELCARDERD